MSAAGSDAPIPIIIDTDIGEDIDDLLVLCFALNSPEFEVLAVTTVDGDTAARSRIARRVTAAFGRPEIPVVAGFPRPIPQGEEPCQALTAVHQNDVAATEDGLPPACPLKADELIAHLADQRPGEVYVLTIGSLTNVGRMLIRYPQSAGRLKAIVSNGGNFRPGREATIGWNLRYDPIASATAARWQGPWVLLSEGTSGPVHPTADDIATLEARGLETTRIMMAAIAGWRKNKRECTPTSIPHVSDLNVFAYLLGYVRTYHGRACITVGPPDQTAGLRLEEDPAGPHTLGWQIEPSRVKELHDLLIERLLAEPIARKGG